MLRYAIVGCGSAARYHLFHLQQNPLVKIVALCDPSAEIAAPFRSLAVKRYIDFQEMFDSEELDAVSLVTPHYLHYDQIMACAKRGIHVLCEKPLAISYSDGEKVVAACERAEVKLAVMLPRRLFNNTEALKKALATQALGKVTASSYILHAHKGPEYYQGWRGKKEFAGGGVVMCQALHDLDRLVYCFGPATVISSKLNTTRLFIDVEDTAEVVLEFSGGLRCSFHADTISTESWTGKTIILGTQGNVVLNSEYTEEWSVPGIPQPEPNDDNYDPEVKPRYYGPCHGIIINDFIESITQNREPLISGKSTLPTLQVLFEIYGKAKSSLS